MLFPLHTAPSLRPLLKKEKQVTQKWPGLLLDRAGVGGLSVRSRVRQLQGVRAGLPEATAAALLSCQRPLQAFFCLEDWV